MNILLLGHKGYLGAFIKEVFAPDVTPRNIKYDYVINCIGKPNLEYCESNPEVSYRSNYEVVEQALAEYPDSKFIHFSSYYVYDDSGYCTEESITTKKYKYCEHKLLSENIVSQREGVSFRIGKIFGHSKGKKQNKLTEMLLFSKRKIILDDVRFNPTSLNQIGRAIEHELANGDLKGVYNLSNVGDISHYEYGCYMKENFNPNLKIERIKKHTRIFHNYGRFLMSCSKIKKTVPLLNWKKDMVQYLEELKCIA